MHVRQQRDLALEPLRAVRPLRPASAGSPAARSAPRRPCRRRAAAARRRACTDSAWLASPTRCSAGEQEVAGAVAGEDPARPVAAVRGRRQPEDQHPRGRIAEARHRPAPVGLSRGTPPASRARPARATRPGAGSGGSRRPPRLSASKAAMDESMLAAATIGPHAPHRSSLAAVLALAPERRAGPPPPSQESKFTRRPGRRSPSSSTTSPRPAAARRRGEDLHRDPRQAARGRAQERRRRLRDRDGPRDQRRQRLRPAGRRRQGQRRHRHRAGPPGRRAGKVATFAFIKEKGGWRASALGARASARAACSAPRWRPSAAATTSRCRGTSRPSPPGPRGSRRSAGSSRAGCGSSSSRWSSAGRGRGGRGRGRTRRRARRAARGSARGSPCWSARRRSRSGRSRPARPCSRIRWTASLWSSTWVHSRTLAPAP